MLTGARPEAVAVAGALGDTVEATFDRWHEWALRQRDWAAGKSQRPGPDDIVEGKECFEQEVVAPDELVGGGEPVLLLVAAVAEAAVGGEVAGCQGVDDAVGGQVVEVPVGDVLGWLGELLAAEVRGGAARAPGGTAGLVASSGRWGSQSQRSRPK
jgi:hypothetical protein